MTNEIELFDALYCISETLDAVAFLLKDKDEATNLAIIRADSALRDQGVALDNLIDRLNRAYDLATNAAVLRLFDRRAGLLFQYLQTLRDQIDQLDRLTLAE